MPEVSQEELDLLRSKAAGFDRLIHDLASLLPPDAAIKKLAGLSFLDAIKDYQFTPKPPEPPKKERTLDDIYELEAKYTATVGGHR